MKNKQKYLVITPFFPSSEGHVGSYVYDQVKTIKEISNFDVIIVKITSFFSSEQDYNFKGFDVKVFKVLDLPFFIFPTLFNWFNLNRFKSFIFLNGIADDLKFVHSHVCYPSVYLANYISRFLNVKILVHHHGVDSLQLLNCRFEFLRFLQRNFFMKRQLNELNKVNLNVYVSNKVRNNLCTFENYIPKNEFILYNGVDRSKFFNKNQSKKSNFFTIGCVANFWKIKDQITLIKSVELIVNEGYDNFILRLIGSGEELQKCLRYVKRNNLSSYIFFESEMPHHKLNDFYNSIDLFVLPSYYEALGCVSMEAWATDTPVLSVFGQGFSELIPEDEYENLLFPQRSPIILKEKIQKEYNRKREFAFNKNFDIKNKIQEFLIFISQI